MPSKLTPQGHCDLHMPGWITVASLFSTCNVRHNLPLSSSLLLLSAGVYSGQWRVRGKIVPNYLLHLQYDTMRKINLAYSVFSVLKRHANLHGFCWVKTVTTLGRTIYFEIVSQQEVRFVALVKFSTHWRSFFSFIHNKAKKHLSISDE